MGLFINAIKGSLVRGYSCSINRAKQRATSFPPQFITFRLEGLRSIALVLLLTKFWGVGFAEDTALKVSDSA